jgi:excisionase family DNA binding protein
VVTKVWDRLVRIDEAAEYLGVSRRTLYNWVQAGRVPVVRLSPRAIRFDRRVLEKWIQERSELVPGAGQ